MRTLGNARANGGGGTCSCLGGDCLPYCIPADDLECAPQSFISLWQITVSCFPAFLADILGRKDSSALPLTPVGWSLYEKANTNRLGSYLPPSFFSASSQETWEKAKCEESCLYLHLVQSLMYDGTLQRPICDDVRPCSWGNPMLIWSRKHGPSCEITNSLGGLKRFEQLR